VSTEDPVYVPLTDFDFEDDDEDVEVDGVALGDADVPVFEPFDVVEFWLVPVLFWIALVPRAETDPPERDLNESSRARPTAVNARARTTLRIGATSLG
jgi:hypothetical protein